MTSCSCSPGACHGGHTINMGMPRLTDEQLARVTQGQDWLSQSERQSMAAELLAARARVAELESASITKRLTTVELSKVGELALARLYAERDRDEARARVTALKAAVAARDEQLEAARCRATTVDPTNVFRPSCAWCVLPAGHQGMHRAELTQDAEPATLEWLDSTAGVGGVTE